MDYTEESMALEMTGEYVLPLERAKVYAALNDPDMLKRCIPGCEELEKLSGTEFAAVVRVELGPVKARFKGKVRLEDLDPPNGYRIAGEGEGGVAGFAKGGATVSLSEVPEGTKLAYRAEASVGGKIAQMGQRLLAGSAKKIADKFFNNFTTALGGAPKA
jgi:carbon monoxide dehydrogenase subunit G